MPLVSLLYATCQRLRAEQSTSGARHTNAMHLGGSASAKGYVSPSVQMHCCSLVTKLSPTLFATPWTVAHQAPLSMRFSTQEYWSGFLFLSPRDLPNPGIKPTSPTLSGGFFITEPLEKPTDVLKWSDVKLLSHVRLFATPWPVACQAPTSMGFFRQEYWSGLPFPSPGDLPKPGIEPGSPTL